VGDGSARPTVFSRQSRGRRQHSRQQSSLHGAAQPCGWAGVKSCPWGRAVLSRARLTQGGSPWEPSSQPLLSPAFTRSSAQKHQSHFSRGKQVGNSTGTRGVGAGCKCIHPSDCAVWRRRCQPPFITYLDSGFPRCQASAAPAHYNQQDLLRLSGGQGGLLQLC